MVRDPAVHLEVIEKVIDYARTISFAVKNLEFSPIKGPEGNIEYLLYLKKIQEGETETVEEIDPAKVVEKAHKTLT